MQDRVLRFAKLFRGSPDSHGCFYPDRGKGGKGETVSSPYTLDDFKRHLAGMVGLGIVPIMPDHMCYWGAIDIDAHADDEEIDLANLDRKVREYDLPLVICRTKSAGAHCYLFAAEPIPAKLMRQTLIKWADLLGFAGSEIFPKQDKLVIDEDGTVQLGNWLNLPFFDCDDPDQLRYMYDVKPIADVDRFIDTAENKKMSASLLVEKAESDHGGAPPCVVRMISNGVKSGHRNTALFQLGVYAKKAYPEDWKNKTFDFNARIFETPLEYSEAKKVVDSLGRREYKYKCKDEPCRSLCNSQTCVQRMHGIEPEEEQELKIGVMPKIHSLKRLDTKPVWWYITLGDHTLQLSTADLMDFRRVRYQMLEQTTTILPNMKNDRWLVMVNKLIETVEIIDAPEEASAEGIIWEKLVEFAEKLDVSREPQQGDREMLRRGNPILEWVDDEKCLVFKGSSFVNFLKQHKAEELKNSALWQYLRDKGVHYKNMRVNRSSRPVWYISLKELGIINKEGEEVVQQEPRDVEAEF